MKNKITTTFFSLLLLIITDAYSQEKTPLNTEFKNSYAEKIYLQPVSTVFTTDKTIWYKAIVTDLEHLPTKQSGVLHVDLIDFDENILDSKLLKIEKGIADGSFDLNEEMPSGRYLIRGYTEWNKNFGDEFISQTYVDVYAPKEIKKEDQAIRNITLKETENEQYQISAKAYPELLNPKFKGKLKMYIHTEEKTDSLEVEKDEDNNYSFSYLLPKNAIKARLELQLDSIKARNYDYKQFSSYSKTIAVNKEYLDLQFFPEGGKLVDGLISTLAFKALDYNNKGKQVIGTIVDEQNKIITSFKSNALGMGTTQLTPILQNTYYAIVRGEDGIEYRYSLPKTNKTGVVLNVTEVEEFIVIGLKTKKITQEQFHVKVQARGKEQDSFYLQLKNIKASAGLEKSKLPEGIIKFTITNQANQIVAERLFFNDKGDKERIFINTTLDKEEYKQREKTVINIVTEDEEVNTIKTNLSVLVINKEQLGKENSLRSNILSYFLLNSELKGNIENPNYYFNKKNQTRKQDVDALLLTQGWSNYKYENSVFNKDVEFLPEKGLTVSGRIMEYWNSKKGLKKPIDLTVVYGFLKTATQKIDSTGRFKFELEDYYENNFNVVLQTKDKNGKKKDFNIDIDTYKSPVINYKTEETVQLADGVSMYVKENIKRKQIEQSFKLAEGTIELEEIELTGYKMTPQRQKMMDTYGAPNIVIENKELLSKEKSWHFGLKSIIQSAYPDDIRTSYSDTGEIYIHVKGGVRTCFFVDGKLLDFEAMIPQETLDYIPIEEVKSFEVINRSKSTVSGLYIKPRPPHLTGIISIYTYAGKGINYVKRAEGIHKKSIQGFSPKIEFYVPKYGNDDINEWAVPDLRSVVHWSPNVNTNEFGEAKIEYYNADNKGEMLIVIEGITQQGKIGYSELSYTVDEK